MQNRPFHRMRSHRGVAGICAGLAYALGMQTSVVRLLVIVLMFLSFSVVFWAYLIVWIVADEWDVDPADYGLVTVK